MRRATTPTHKYILPFETSEIKTLRVTYAQDCRIIVEKKESDATYIDEKTIQVTLSQSETVKFDAEKPIKIQVRILTNDDKALASQIYTRPCEDVLNSEVLV